MKTKQSNRFLFASTIVCCLAVLPMAATATPLYWDTNTITTAGSGAATGTWGTSIFWSTDPLGLNGPPAVTLTLATTNNDDLYFSAGTNGTAGTVTVTGTQPAHSVTFDDPVAITVSGGTAINLGSATADSGLFFTANVANTISTPIVLNSGATAVTLSNSGTALQTLSGIISGGATTPVTVNSSGSGPIALTAANTFSGGLALQAGTLILGNAAAAGTGAITSTGGTLDSNTGHTLTNAFNSDFSYGGTAPVIANNSTVRNMTLSANMPLTANRTITVNGNTGLAARAGGNNNLTLSGVVSGVGFSLTKAGTGTLSLNNLANTFSGGLTINAGALRQLAPSSWNSTANNITFGGGVLELGNTTTATWTTGSSTITVASATGLAPGQVITSVGNGFPAAPVTITAISGTTITLSAPTTGAQATASAVGVGLGTYTLGTGAGQINLTGGGGFSAASLGATINLNSNAAITWGTTPNFVGASNALKFGSLTSAATITLSNAINLGGAARTIDATRGTGSNTHDGVLSGAITNGSIIKTGNGAVTLSNTASSITAATISGGTLGINPTTFANTNVLLNGGMFRAGANYTGSLGSGNGQVRFAGGAVDGGFSADSGANRTINIGGAGATLTWNSTPDFLGTGALMLNSMASGYTTILANGLDLNGADRTIYVEDGGAAYDARIDGVISGTGGLIKSGGDINGNGRLLLTGANTYTGATTIRNGSMYLNSSVLNNVPGPLGNSASAINITDASTLSAFDAGAAGFVALYAQGLDNTQTATAAGDAQQFTVERPIIINGTTPTTVPGRVRIGLLGNGGAGFDTNRLTLGGAITLGTGNRHLELYSERSGQTIDVTGNITGGSTVYLTGNVNTGATVDGRANGNFRLSNVARPFTGTLNVTLGSLTIEGSVPATGASPHGTQALGLADGNGGNTLNSSGRDAIRSVYLETPGATYARVLNPGQGSTLTPTAGAQQNLYGTGNVNLMNGHRFGGVNNTGTVTFSGNVTPFGVAASVTGTAGGGTPSLGTNPITTVHNLALMAATGGTVEFTGVISGATAPPLGSTTTPGGSNNTGNNTRITINQFRNHPNLDENVNGVADPGVANALVGAPTGGTVVLKGNNTYGGSTEILGGTLRLDYSSVDDSKLPNATNLILSGGTLELVGGIHQETVGSTTVNGPSTISSSSNEINLGAITRNAGGSVNFTAENIATTSTPNDASGVLGFWATINGTDLAANDGFGYIVAYAGYSDVTRTNSGLTVIVDSPTSNIRITEGTGTPENLIIFDADTTINTLTQSDVDGTGAATIDPVGRILRTKSILVQPAASGLTIGTGTNNGTLTAATPGGDLLLQNNSASPLTIKSVIADNTNPSTLTVGGTGTTILTGANTYTGATTIASGTLQIGDGTTDGSLASTSIVNNSALVYNLTGSQTYANVITGSGSLTKSGAGSLILSGANTFAGTTTISAGSLQLGSGGTTGAISTTGPLANAGTFIVNRSNTVTQGTDFPSVISGAGGVTLTGTSGGTSILNLNGANTYDGQTTINVGVVNATTANALGSNVGGTRIIYDGTSSTGGRLDISGNLTINESITVAGGRNGNNYISGFRATGGTVNLTNPLIIDGTTNGSEIRVGAENAGTVLNFQGGVSRTNGPTGGGLLLFKSGTNNGVIINFNGAIDNNGGTVEFTDGLSVLNVTSTLVGNMQIDYNGKVKLGVNDAFPATSQLRLGHTNGSTSTDVAGATGTLDLAGYNLSVARIEGSSGASTATTANRKITNSSSGNSILTIGAAATNQTFNGIIEDGSGGGKVSLVKTGANTQTLTSTTDDDTYTGDTTINGGKLILGGVKDLADTANVIINGATSILELPAGVTDTITVLKIDGVNMAVGTWGGTGSGAANIDPVHFTGTGKLNVTSIGDDYVSWDNDYAADLSNKAGDNDNDGLTNFEEYAFGLDPTSGSEVNPISQPLDKATGTFKYTRRATPATTNVTYTYESSTTLNNDWVLFSSTPVEETDGDPTVEEITVHVPSGLLSHPKLFIHVKASQP